MKKKVYVLMISKTFPATHPRRGDDTNFLSKILASCGGEVPWEANGQKYLLDQKAYYSQFCFENNWDKKIHTIRSNYDLWKKRADKINAGEAVLSLRQWSGEPYKSKQVEFMQLEKVGVERISLKIFIGQVIGDVQASVNGWTLKEPAKLIKNDGLSVSDFAHWFKKDFEGVIIHFSDFRYS